MLTHASRSLFPRLLALLPGLLFACASAAPAPSTPSSLPAVVAILGAHSFWFGRSAHSPFGPIPYGIAAHRDGDTVVLRVDVPPGGGMPPGAYQQFTLSSDNNGSHLDFETSLTGTVVSGRMIEASRSADEVHYCMATGVTPPTSDCAALEVLFRAEPDDAIRFETRRSGSPHHSVVLRATRP
jgi:hypothetical protein